MSIVMGRGSHHESVMSIVMGGAETRDGITQQPFSRHAHAPHIHDGAVLMIV
jgi:hypothetical protein